MLDEKFLWINIWKVREIGFYLRDHPEYKITQRTYQMILQEEQKYKGFTKEEIIDPDDEEEKEIYQENKQEYKEIVRIRKSIEKNNQINSNYFLEQEKTIGRPRKQKGLRTKRLNLDVFDYEKEFRDRTRTQTELYQRIGQYTNLSIGSVIRILKNRSLRKQIEQSN